MSPQAAALVAAGVASLVNVVALFAAHWLTLRRERRARLRQRLDAVIHDAAVALVSDSDAEIPDASPGSLAAEAPRAVAVFLRCVPHYKALTVVLGGDHPLAASYMDAVTVTAELEVTMQDALTRTKALGHVDQDAVGDAAAAAIQAKDVRENWTKAAQKHLKRV